VIKRVSAPTGAPMARKKASGPRARRATAAQCPVPEAPARLADLRRRQILDAAEECFRKHGFHSASMSEIAKSFGMSAGHIYNYFDSKEAIIAGIVQRDLEEFIKRAAQMQRAGDMQAALLERVDDGVAEQLNPCRAARQFEVLAEAGRNPQVLAMVQEVDAKVRAVLRDIFRKTQSDGHSGRDLDGKVAVLMALFDGLMVRGLRQSDVPRAQVTRVLRSVIGEMMR
jgi:TetR/AcrR family transcriptional repressor of uid operon